MDKKGTPNALIHESSPYLLQHAYNPVEWYPWGPEALQLAKEKDLPILVSIGYSACHWCHVMEAESFENPATAAFMNSHFINIKIDREERPDLDHIYMDAVQAISGSGGWPLNVFLTPDKKPFYGGTYFPPRPAHNRPSWLDVLYSMSEYWKNKRAEIEEQADSLIKYLKNSNDIIEKKEGTLLAPGESFYSKEKAARLAEKIMANADKEYGGFGRPPKFLQTFSLQCLLQYAEMANADAYGAHALFTMQKMLEGGIYDQLGGGIARYSTDARWLVPHFEKMLYDNALLTIALCDAYQLTGDAFYKRAIEATLTFILTEFRHPAGGYYTALDADSEGVEGKYYVWSKDEITQLLGNDAALFCDYFNVSENGNWEHANILNISGNAEEIAAVHNISEPRLCQTITACKQLLLAARAKRPSPALDDKILLNCNALLLKALCNGYAALQHEPYKQAAIELEQFIEANLKEQQGGLLHSYKNGIARFPAFLDDYAYYIEALISLQEITAQKDYLVKARTYLYSIIEAFSDNGGLYFYYTPQQQRDVVIRKTELYDGATPSANAVMCSNLYYLGIVFNNEEWKNRAQKMLSSIYPAMEKYTGSFARWALIYIQQSFETAEIAVVGKDFEALLTKILKKFIPNKVIMAAAFEEKQDWPLLQSKPGGSETFIYLCRNFSCMPPVLDENGLLFNIKNIWKG